MKKILYILLFAFLLFDTALSFIQHYNYRVDGDLSYNVLPDISFKKAMGDPFGFNVLLRKERYNGTNRAFAHLSMSGYFKQVPLALQLIFSPVNSIYISTALAKTLIQVLLIYLMAVYVTGSFYLFSKEFLLAAAIITPFYQATGYSQLIGIIDPSITYTFFYALSLGLVLVFFLPVFLKLFHKRNVKFNLLTGFLMIVLILVLSFFGPLNSGVVLVVILLIILHQLINTFKNNPELGIKDKLAKTATSFPGFITFCLMLVTIFCLYSFYIGTYNLQNTAIQIPLSDRFMKIPNGLKIIWTTKPGPPLFLLMLVINTVLLKIQEKNPEQQKILKIFRWIGLFILIYLLLLPFGGYREYRPNLIRRDTLIPVMLSLMFYFTISSIYLIKSSKLWPRRVFITLLTAFLMLFTLADRKIKRESACEREMINVLVLSDEKIVQLDNHCTLMGWDLITDYEKSRNNTALLQYWRVLDEEKYYFQTRDN